MHPLLGLALSATLALNPALTPFLARGAGSPARSALLRAAVGFGGVIRP